MKSKKQYLYFFLLVVFVIEPKLVLASEVDSNIVRRLIIDSNCEINAEAFSSDFSDAIDRLYVINPVLVGYIRNSAYLRPISIICDVPKEGAGIYFSFTDNTIHLREGAPNPQTVASFFHEFLHFVGVKVDFNYHNNPDLRNFVEVDSVYACHLAVFPELAVLENLDPSRISTARTQCSSASIFESSA